MALYATLISGIGCGVLTSQYLSYNNYISDINKNLVNGKLTSSLMKDCEKMGIIKETIEGGTKYKRTHYINIGGGKHRHSSFSIPIQFDELGFELIHEKKVVIQGLSINYSSPITENTKVIDFKANSTESILEYIPAQKRFGHKFKNGFPFFSQYKHLKYEMSVGSLATYHLKNDWISKTPSNMKNVIRISKGCTIPRIVMGITFFLTYPFYKTCKN